VRIYLRKIYEIGADMEFLGSSPAQKEQLKALAKQFRTEIKAMDVPCKKRDVAEFMKQHQSTTSLIARFFEIRLESSDVPDEL